MEGEAAVEEALGGVEGGVDDALAQALACDGTYGNKGADEVSGAAAMQNTTGLAASRWFKRADPCKGPVLGNSQ